MCGRDDSFASNGGIFGAIDVMHGPLKDIVG